MGVVRALRVAACVAAVATVTLAGVHRDAAPSPPPADAAPAATPPPVDLTTLTVRARYGALDRVAALAASRGYAVLSRSDDLGALQVSIPPGAIQRAVTDFTRSGGVLYSEPGYRMAAADVPADPLYSRQQAYLDPIKAPQAWDIERGKPSAIVAVLDSGADSAHPDLRGRIWTNTREALNGLDDDNNGCIDDLHGCAFISDPDDQCARAENGDIDDDLGHGTFVAGIVAANGNGTGMVGIARNATVMPVKVLDCAGTGNSFSLAQGILYAASAGAKVLNVSLGGPVDSAIVREAVTRASAEFGALVVAASGNSGKAGVTYPARYDNVLAVGAASSADPDARASFSTYGPEVDVVAVGEHIIGTVPAGLCRVFLPCIDGEPYAIGDGTSFSAPQVSGLVALMISRNSGMTPASIIDKVKQTATPLPPGDRPDWAGAGRVDMREALRAYRIGAPGVARN